MQRIFTLEDLDCANCARKLQDKISAVDGISNCTVTFLTQKLTYDVEDAKNADAEAAMRKIVKDFEPDITIEVVK